MENKNNNLEIYPQLGYAVDGIKCMKVTIKSI